MKSSPLVSVIIVNRNHAHYLSDCLKSVANQNYKSLEIIVIDGNSSDDSLNVLKATADITYISEPDNSSGHAFSKGVNLSSGDYITFLNSSDGFYDVKWIEEAVETLAREPVISMICGDVVGVDDAKNLNGYRWPSGGQFEWSGEEIYLDWLLNGAGTTPITFVIRRQVLIDCAPKIELMGKPNLDGSVDFFWYLFGEYFRRGYLSYKLPIVCSFVRFHSDRVDDSAYLTRQRMQLHRQIIKHRRSLLFRCKSVTFITPEKNIAVSREISYPYLFWRTVRNRSTKLANRFCRIQMLTNLHRFKIHCGKKN